MPSYTMNKEHAIKWRKNNPDRHRELSRVHMRKHRIWKTAQIQFLQILL